MQKSMKRCAHADARGPRGAYSRQYAAVVPRPAPAGSSESRPVPEAFSCAARPTHLHVTTTAIDMDARVDALAKDVSTLSKTLGDIEAREAAGAGSSSAGLQQYQRQVLEELKSLRLTLEEERAAMQKIIAERDAVRGANPVPQRREDSLVC